MIDHTPSYMNPSNGTLSYTFTLESDSGVTTDVSIQLLGSSAVQCNTVHNIPTLTHCGASAEHLGNSFIQLALLTQLELHQVHLHLTVLHVQTKLHHFPAQEREGNDPMW